LKPELPDKIKVAGYDIKIINWHPLQAGNVQRYGEFSSHLLEIKIDMSASDGRVLDILLHEIYHAVYWAYDIQDEDKEERIVNVFSTAMNQVYLDNPDLLRYINESVLFLKEED